MFLTSLSTSKRTSRILLFSFVLFVFLFSISGVGALYVTDKKMCRDQPTDDYCYYSNGYYDPQDEVWFFWRTYGLASGTHPITYIPTIYTPWGDEWDYSPFTFYIDGYYWYYWWWWHWYGADYGYTWYPGSYRAKYDWYYYGQHGTFYFYFTIKGLTINSIRTCSRKPENDYCASNLGHYRTTDTVWLFWRTWWVNHRDGCYDLKIEVSVDTPDGYTWRYDPWYFKGCDGRWDYRWWWWSWGGNGYVWKPGKYTAHYRIYDRKVYNFERSFDVSWIIDAPDCSVYNGCNGNLIYSNCRYDENLGKCVCDKLSMPEDGYYCKNSNILEYRDYNGCSGNNWIYTVTNSFDCNSLNKAGVNYTCEGDYLYKINYSYDYDCSNGVNQHPGAECKLSHSSWSNKTLVANCNDYDGWYCNGDTREYRDYTCSTSGCEYNVTKYDNCTFGCGYINNSAVCEGIKLTGLRLANLSLPNVTIEVNYSSIGIGGNTTFVVDVLSGTPPNCTKLWCGSPESEKECGACLDGQLYYVNISPNTYGTIYLPLLLKDKPGTYRLRVRAYDSTWRLYDEIWLDNNITISSVNGISIGFQPQQGKGSSSNKLLTNKAMLGVSITLSGGIAGAIIYYLHTRNNVGRYTRKLANSLEKVQKIFVNITKDNSTYFSKDVKIQPTKYENITYPPPKDESHEVPQPQGRRIGEVNLEPIWDNGKYDLDNGSPPAVPPYHMLPGYEPPGISPNDPYKQDFYEGLRLWAIYYLANGYDLSYLARKYNVSVGFLIMLAGGYDVSWDNNQDDNINDNDNGSENYDDSYYGITYPLSFWESNDESDNEIVENPEDKLHQLGFSGATDAINWLKEKLEGPLDMIGNIPLIGDSLRFAIDVVVGFLDGLAQTIDGLVTFVNMMIHDPLATINMILHSIWDAITHLGETINGIINYFKEDIDDGHPGRAVGKALFEIVAFVVTPAKIAEALGLTEKIASVTSKLMEMLRSSRISSWGIKISKFFAKHIDDFPVDKMDDLAGVMSRLDDTFLKRIYAVRRIKGVNKWINELYRSAELNGGVPSRRIVSKIIGELELVEKFKNLGYKILQVGKEGIKVKIPRRYWKLFSGSIFENNGVINMEVDAVAMKGGRLTFIEKKRWISVGLGEGEISRRLASFERQVVKYKYLAKANHAKAIFDIDVIPAYRSRLIEILKKYGFKLKDGVWVYDG